MILENLRNIGIVAHIDAGKTTTTERILYYTGKNHKVGEVHEGSSSMDWMEQEQERGITITAAAATCFWVKGGKKCQINIIDTPGHVDFTLEVERSLRVLDGAVVVLCGVAGLQPQTETVWKQVNAHKIPRLVFVNKLDRKGSDYSKVLAQIESRFGVDVIPVTVPWLKNDDVAGVLHLLEKKACVFSLGDYGSHVEKIDIPEECALAFQAARETMLEKLSKYDDLLLEALLEGKAVLEEDVVEILRRECISGNVVPSFAGSSFKNKGVQPLLDGVIQFLPSPIDLPLVMAWSVKKKVNFAINMISDEDFVALVFKVQANIFSNPVCYLKIYSGILKPGSVVYNASKEKKERIAKIYRMHSNKREELDFAEVGQIVAVVGPSQSTTGDTLSSKLNPVLLEPIAIPEPVISVAIEPKSKAEEEQLNQSLEKICLEDPSLRVILDKETGQTLISGMGELHLEITIDRLKREYALQANIGKPQVSHRETVQISVCQQEVFSKQIQGKNVSASMLISIEPEQNVLKVKNTIEFDSSIVLGKDIKAAILSGVKDGLLSGVVLGYPVVRTKVFISEANVIEGEVSSEIFFAIASGALRKCLRKAEPKLLEPIMEVEVVGPGAFSGDIINHLSSVGGRILSMHDEKGEVTVMAEVKLSAMFGYLTVLRSLTQGKASYTMVFAHYA